MKRKIVEIDQEKCTGCGLCVSACHEGAIQMVNGKAKLVSDSYCDGLGACLPACPTDAIRIVEREAEAFSEEAVQARQAAGVPPLPCGCPGTMAKALRPTISITPEPVPAAAGAAVAPVTSQLTNWPVQIKLISPNAPYLQGASLLIAADCTAFAHADFHARFMRNKVTLIGCPKLDEGDYTEKLTEILRVNDIRKVTVVRMEVPCCGGIVAAVQQALINSGKMIPWQVVILSREGRVIEE